MNAHDVDPAAKTNMQNYVDGTRRIAYGIVLLLVSLLGVGMIAELMSGTAYGSLVGLLYIATYILLAPALLLLVLGKQVPRAMHLVAKAMAGLLGVILIFMAIGNVRDGLGARCYETSGAAISCGDSHLSLAFVLLISPYAFLPLVVFCLAGLAKGWRDYMKQRSPK